MSAASQDFWCLQNEVWSPKLPSMFVPAGYRFCRPSHGDERSAERSVPHRYYARMGITSFKVTPAVADVAIPWENHGRDRVPIRKSDRRAARLAVISN